MRAGTVDRCRRHRRPVATRDAGITGQIFFCLPVLYAATPLRVAGAILATVAAIAGEGAVVLALLPHTQAFTELSQVGTTLALTGSVLIRAGVVQDRLRAQLRQQAAIDPLTGLVTRRASHTAQRGARPRALYASAEAALYLAKHGGRGRVGPAPRTPQPQPHHPTPSNSSDVYDVERPRRLHGRPQRPRPTAGGQITMPSAMALSAAEERVLPPTHLALGEIGTASVRWQRDRAVRRRDVRQPTRDGRRLLCQELHRS